MLHVLASEYRRGFTLCQGFSAKTSHPGKMAAKVSAPEGFGGRLREALRRAGLNQRTFADRMRVKESTISNWVRAEREPDLQTLARIATVLHTSVDWLLSVPGATPPDPDAIRQAVNEAVRNARDEMRGEILAVFEHGSKKDDGRR
jgi:transcriptional regulator with XRE-family HTH domain